MKPSVLVVEDELLVSLEYSSHPICEEFNWVTAETLSAAKKIISGRSFEAVLLDVFLPDGNGIDFIPDLRTTLPSAMILAVSGAGNISMAVEAMRRGADNFLPKPVAFDNVYRLLKEGIDAKGKHSRHVTFSGYNSLTRSRCASMTACMNSAASGAQSDLPVLILGETGTGKSMLARWIHENSPRSKRPFVEVNCSSLKGDLLANELFGHARGAFTGAVSDHEGLIALADGGTLFLDEIGDMDLSVQASILTVIEERTFRRIGETKTRHSDFRLICATNRDIVRHAAEERFRQDLFYRINVINLPLPPLRERIEDLPVLIGDILASHGRDEVRLSPDVIALLSCFSWPGNIRELKNTIERVVLVGQNDVFTSEMFDALLHVNGSAPRLAPQEDATNDKTLRDSILAVLQQTGGCRKEAARVLGISRATLYRKMHRLGME